jgi:hypothetical protein
MLLFVKIVFLRVLTQSHDGIKYFSAKNGEQKNVLEEKLCTSILV